MALETPTFGTGLQRFVLRLGDLLHDARRELTGREYVALVDVLCAVAARLSAEQLDREERP
jgi:hypothetical protein